LYAYTLECVSYFAPPGSKKRLVLFVARISLSEVTAGIVPGNCYIFLVCPFCHRSKWVLLIKPGATRDEILNTFWSFECPAHGSLYEKPLYAEEKFTKAPPAGRIGN
jgi:hypothetical protein